MGATVTALNVPDKHGKFADVVLGFDNAHDYLAESNPYFGATVGRVGNRYFYLKKLKKTTYSQTRLKRLSMVKVTVESRSRIHSMYSGLPNTRTCALIVFEKKDHITYG